MNHIGRNHPFQIVGMFPEIIPQRNLQHHGTLVMAGKNKRASLIIMFKIVVQRRVNICPLFLHLVSHEFVSVHPHHREDVALAGNKARTDS